MTAKNTPRKAEKSRAASGAWPDTARVQAAKTRGKRSEPKPNLGNWGSCEGQTSLFGD